MQYIGRDIISYIFKCLDSVSDCVNFSLTCKEIYRHSNFDPMWKNVKKEYGDISKSDFKVKHNSQVITWDLIYETMHNGLIMVEQACHFDADDDKIEGHKRYMESIYNIRKPHNEDNVRFCQYRCVLYRTSLNSMIIPKQMITDKNDQDDNDEDDNDEDDNDEDDNDEPRVIFDANKELLQILPRRGDTLLDLEDFFYRNNGITFYNGKDVIDMNRTSDDYGATPIEFAYPEFPFNYFYNGHNNIQNILITPDMNIDYTYNNIKGSGKFVIILHKNFEYKATISANEIIKVGDYWSFDGINNEYLWYSGKETSQILYKLDY